MFSTFKTILLLLAISTLKLVAFSQAALDSIVREHQAQMYDYVQYKSTMDSRTWTRLVELGQKADELIQTDKALIEDYLNRELRKNTELEKELENLKLEMGLYKKESDVQQMILEEQRFLNKTMLIGIIALGVLFIIFLILFIDRQTRYSSIKLELEYLWSKKDEPSSSAIDTEKLESLENRLQKLRQDNKQLQTQMTAYKSEKEKLEANLSKEQESRLRVEKEIKTLLKKLHQNV